MSSSAFVKKVNRFDFDVSLWKKKELFCHLLLNKNLNEVWVSKVYDVNLNTSGTNVEISILHFKKQLQTPIAVTKYSKTSFNCRQNVIPKCNTEKKGRITSWSSNSKTNLAQGSSKIKNKDFLTGVFNSYLILTKFYINFFSNSSSG